MDFRSKFFQESNILFKKGSLTVYSLVPDRCNKGIPVVLVPSLINRSYIFSLGKDGGFLGYLINCQELDIYLLDFDHPLEEEKNFRLVDYIESYICFTINEVFSIYVERVVVMGYCLGGILSLSSAIILQNKIRALVLVATPWNFQYGIYKKIYANIDMLNDVIKYFTIIPYQFLLNGFALLQLNKIIAKYNKLSNLDGEDKELFWQIENWLHDGINITQNVLVEILLWIKQNILVSGKWKVNEYVIKPSIIDVPTLLVIPKNDLIVPLESALDLIKSVKRSYIVFSEKGHINMFVKKCDSLWELIFLWIKSN